MFGLQLLLYLGTWSLEGIAMAFLAQAWRRTLEAIAFLTCRALKAIVHLGTRQTFGNHPLVGTSTNLKSITAFLAQTTWTLQAIVYLECHLCRIGGNPTTSWTLEAVALLT